MDDDSHVFTASRFTEGNLLFPVRIVITPQRVSRIKPRMFGSEEESIPMSKVASVHINTGVIWADVRIDSTGGSSPITSHGHTKEDAREMRDLIEKYQAGH